MKLSGGTDGLAEDIQWRQAGMGGNRYHVKLHISNSKLSLLLSFSIYFKGLALIWGLVPVVLYADPVLLIRNVIWPLCLHTSH